MLLYGHFDVQPPAPLDEWETPPFEASVRDGWVYARGIADDKGQLYMLLEAAGRLAREGGLPVNVKVACDGEEETGGQTIVRELATGELDADACIIFDAPMVRRGVPAFNVATRGLAYFHLRVRTGERDLHSGIFGGVALNAMHVLVQVLSALLPRDGRLAEPLRQGAASPDPDEMAGWAELPDGGSELADQGARPADERAAAEFYARTWGEPSLDVHGLAGGSPHLQKTVLPVVAEANLSIRLTPGQSPADIASELESLVVAAAPSGADIDLDLLSWAEAGLVSADSPVLAAASTAFERVLGVRPLLVRSGGTLPVLPALAGRGIETVLTGFALPDSNIHAPNERLPLEHLELGIRAARELLIEFGRFGAETSGRSLANC